MGLRPGSALEMGISGPTRPTESKSEFSRETTDVLAHLSLKSSGLYQVRTAMSGKKQLATAQILRRLEKVLVVPCHNPPDVTDTSAGFFLPLLHYVLWLLSSLLGLKCMRFLFLELLTNKIRT